MTASVAAIAADVDDADDATPSTPLTPFLKWVGGKRKMTAVLVERILAANPQRYVEPFLGGGAVALAMPQGLPLMLSDVCQPVSHLWWWIMRAPRAIAEYAASYTEQGWNTEEGFAELRRQHNEQPWSDESWEPSARFLWINHACFNGVYRENANGYFNVPWGKRKTIAIPAPEHLEAIADHLNVADAGIYSGADFEEVIDVTGPGDVVFTDPPYDGTAAAFVGYSKHKFGPSEQERLAAACERAVGRGATVIQTNADTERVRKLYRGWTMEAVFEDRPVAADPERRVPAPCLILTSPARYRR